MKDQVQNLRQRGIKAVAIYSGMTRQEILIALENCIFGNYKFLYISPERLDTDIFKQKLRAMKVNMITVDGDMTSAPLISRLPIYANYCRVFPCWP